MLKVFKALFTWEPELTHPGISVHPCYYYGNDVSYIHDKKRRRVQISSRVNIQEFLQVF